MLRVPVLYGHAEKPEDSAVNVLLATVQKAASVGPGADATSVAMDDWARRYPTNTEDVGRVCRDVAAKYLGAGEAGRKGLPKVLQFSAEDRMTKYEMCEVFAEILGVGLGGVRANQQGIDPNASVQRPFDTHLSTRALKELGIEVWTQDFRDWW